jgi:membrane-bound acyltransferase YfiQ involved in biofilm formation
MDDPYSSTQIINGISKMIMVIELLLTNMEINKKIMNSDIDIMERIVINLGLYGLSINVLVLDYLSELIGKKGEFNTLNIILITMFLFKIKNKLIKLLKNKKQNQNQTLKRRSKKRG